VLEDCRRKKEKGFWADAAFGRRAKGSEDPRERRRIQKRRGAHRRHLGAIRTKIEQSDKAKKPLRGGYAGRGGGKKDNFNVEPLPSAKPISQGGTQGFTTEKYLPHRGGVRRVRRRQEVRRLSHLKKNCTEKKTNYVTRRRTGGGRRDK